MANSRFHDLTDIGTLDVSDIIGVDDASDLAGPTKKSTFQKVIDLVKSVVRLNELQTPNTTVNMGGQTIQNVADPVAAQHAATKSYVDANSGGAGGVSNSLAGLALDTPQQWRLPPGRPFLSRGDLAMTADRLAVAPFTAEIPFTISGLACQVAVAPTGSPTVRMAVYEWDDTNHTITGPPLADSGVLTSNNVAEVLSAAITPVDLPAGKYATAYHSPDLLTLSVVRAADGWVESQSDEWRAYAYSYENSSGGILDYTASQPTLVHSNSTVPGFNLVLLDYTTETPSYSGTGIPPAGTAGQVLAKASGTDYDTEWVDPSAGGGTARRYIEWAMQEFSLAFESIAPARIFQDGEVTRWSVDVDSAPSGGTHTFELQTGSGTTLDTIILTDGAIGVAKAASIARTVDSTVQVVPTATTAATAAKGIRITVEFTHSSGVGA